VHAIFILKHVVVGEASFRQASFQEVFPFLYFICFSQHLGFGNLMFPSWFDLLGGSFVFLDVGPSILPFVFPFFGCVLIYL
jgi:hypothetical protein